MSTKFIKMSKYKCNNILYITLLNYSTLLEGNAIDIILLNKLKVTFLDTFDSFATQNKTSVVFVFKEETKSSVFPIPSLNKFSAKFS